MPLSLCVSVVPSPPSLPPTQTQQIPPKTQYLDQEDSSRPIYMYINCPGGSVIAGLAIYDVMQLIRSEIVTINIGMAASMASFLLAAGKKGKRLALPHSRVMIHQPMGGAQGQAEDIKVEAAQILRIKKNLVGMYSKMTGRTPDQIVQVRFCVVRALARRSW